MKGRVPTGFFIVLLSIASACIFGIVHDLISTQVCLEYFTVYHPRIIESEDPVMLAFAWGIVATWWVGLILGFGLAFAATVGEGQVFPAIDVIRPLAKTLLLVLAASAFFWLLTYFLVKSGVFVSFRTDPHLSPETQVRVIASGAAHTMSYLGGAVGALWLGVSIQRRRRAVSGLRLSP